MTSELQLLNALRQSYKNDKKPKIQLYNKMAKALFRYDTDQKAVQYASKAALNKAEELSVNLKELNWHNQRKNGKDPDRKIFHYEHCNPISVLTKDVLTSDKDIAEILKENVVCWILKSENKELDAHHYRSKREDDWKKCYQACGIEPVEIN